MVNVYIKWIRQIKIILTYTVCELKQNKFYILFSSEIELTISLVLLHYLPGIQEESLKKCWS